MPSLPLLVVFTILLQPFHPRNLAKVLNYNGRFITHNYVLAELIALSLVRRFPCSTVLMYSLELMENPNVEMVWVDEILHRETMDLLLVRQDKTYSLCDAISFVLMRKKGIREALTTDKHFEQEGFTRLLQS